MPPGNHLTGQERIQMRMLKHRRELNRLGAIVRHTNGFKQALRRYYSSRGQTQNLGPNDRLEAETRINETVNAYWELIEDSEMIAIADVASVAPKTMKQIRDVINATGPEMLAERLQTTQDMLPSIARAMDRALGAGGEFEALFAGVIPPGLPLPGGDPAPVAAGPVVAGLPHPGDDPAPVAADPVVANPAAGAMAVAGDA